MKGTYGYAAPEYIQTGHLTFKSDVFSFGVVLLEMLTGRRAMDRNRPRMEQRLLEWVKPFINDPRKFHLAMDPRLELRYPTKAAMKFATLAIQCLVKQPKARPKMVDVVEGLKKVLEMTFLWETPTVISTPTTPRSTTNNSTAGPRPPRQSTETTTTTTVHINEGAVPIAKSPRHIALRPTPKPLPGNPFESSNPLAFPLPSLASQRASAPPNSTSPNAEEEAKSALPSRVVGRAARDPSLAMENSDQRPMYNPETPEPNVGEISRVRTTVRSSVGPARSNFVRNGNANRSLDPA